MIFKQKSTYERRSYRMNITPEQCRAARALLGLKQIELSQQSSVSAKTIADFELGTRRPYAATLTVLRQTLEAAGVEFLEPVEGVAGAGVRFRWGFGPIKIAKGKAAGTTDTPSGGLDALGWDAHDALDDFADLVEGDEAPQPTPPLSWTDEDRANQVAYWRGKPEKWADLAEVSRQCLLQAMGVDRL
jgi:transcriptional regulator with XRE-family HTH domain